MRSKSKLFRCPICGRMYSSGGPLVLLQAARALLLQVQPQHPVVDGDHPVVEVAVVRREEVGAHVHRDDPLRPPLRRPADRAARPAPRRPPARRRRSAPAGSRSAARSYAYTASATGASSRSPDPNHTSSPLTSETVLMRSGMLQLLEALHRQRAPDVLQEVRPVEDRRLPHPAQPDRAAVDRDDVLLASASRAISASSRHPIPPARHAPISAPMLVPMIASGRTPLSSSAFHTPMCAIPFIPPPPSTRMVRGWSLAGPIR